MVKFTKHQKDIIRKIDSGEIYDIVSYLKAFNLTTFRKLDKEAVELRMKQKENGATYKKLKEGVQTVTTTSSYNSAMDIPMPQLHINTPTDNDFIYVEAMLDFHATKKDITYGTDATYSFDYSKGIEFTNSFSDVKEFLTIWQYLKSENLVLEVDKKIDRKDLEVFFEYKPIEETNYYRRKTSGQSVEVKYPKGYEPMESKLAFFHDDMKRIKDCRDYVDYYFEYNQSNEAICHQFLGKQIISNPALGLFIKRKFHTVEQRNTFLNLLPAYLALVLTLGISIYQEWDSNKDMQRILNVLSQIETQIENSAFNKKYLEDIEKQLEQIIESGSYNSEMNDKIEGILQEIRDQR
jgi:hypothetical protein